MKNHKKNFVTTIVFLFFSLIVSTVVFPQNKVLKGPYTEKIQSAKKLIYIVFGDWAHEISAIKQLGVYDVIVPSGKTISNADWVITITYRKKDVKDEKTSSLKNFFKNEMDSMAGQFPGMKTGKWLPENLNPEKLSFVSVEIYGDKKDQPSPERLIIIDAGDGYYSIALTVENRKRFDEPLFTEFFSTIRIQ